MNKKELVIKLNGNEIKNLGSFYTKISSGFRFPSYFSGNLDSLSECLNDLSWIDSDDIKIVIENSSNFLSENESDKSKVIQLLNDTSSEWAGVPNYEGEDEFRKKRNFNLVFE